MAKATGRPVAVTVATKVITNDVSSVTFSTPYGTAEVTGLDKSAVERLLLLADCTITLSGEGINTATDMSFSVLKNPASAATKVVVLGITGGTLTATCVQTDYQVTIGKDGNFTWTAPFSLANGTAAAWT